MKTETLPKKTLWLWQIRVVMLTVLFIGVSLWLIPSPKISKISVFALAFLCLVIILLYLPFYFKNYQILFSDDAIIINYGVFIKFSHIMPYSRLIYAQSFATPLARLFGVTALSLKAARSFVLVFEIDLCDAQKIINSLTSEAAYD